MHHDRDMIIHKLIDIPQKARCYNTHCPKGDTSQVYVFVTFGIGNLPRGDNDRISGLVIPDPGDLLQFLEERCTGESDSFTDEGDVGDAEFEHHGAANIFFSVRDELIEKDVVVDAVTYAATDDTDGEGESGDGGNEIVWAYNGSNNGCRYNNATDAEAG